MEMNGGLSKKDLDLTDLTHKISDLTQQKMGISPARVRSDAIRFCGIRLLLSNHVQDGAPPLLSWLFITSVKAQLTIYIYIHICV